MQGQSAFEFKVHFFARDHNDPGNVLSEKLIIEGVQHYAFLSEM